MPEEVVFVAGYQRQTFLAAQSASHYIMGKAQNQSVAKFNRELGGDWALIVLAEPIDGVSPFSLPNASTPPYSLNGLKMAGYAGLRPHVLSLAEDCGDPNMGSWPRAIILFCATMQGDSGAPVFRQGEKNLEIVGLVSAVRGSDGALQALVVPYPNFAETLARLLGDLP